jgi:hypothetical protein
MTSLARPLRTLVVGIIAAAATVSMAQVANAQPTGPNLPQELRKIAVDAGHTVFLVGHAKGVQIYKCDGTAWKFVEPRAELTDDNGKLIVTHAALPPAPTWQATDGSKVVVERRLEWVNVDPKAIGWLKLSVAPAPGSPNGLLTQTKFIQRVETKNGTPPPAENLRGSRSRPEPVTCDDWPSTFQA